VVTQPFDADDLARRRKRSIVLALVLAGLVALFFAITIVRMGAQVMGG
jgi:hypothetical protein